jgi:hypothetical protein
MATLYYPVWQTPAGNLGKIEALNFYTFGFEAIDPNGNSDGSDITYKLISGSLPAGMQVDNSGQLAGSPLDQYLIDGVPEAVTQDRTSTFTIRAISPSGGITDRNFSITITGNYPPQILTSNYQPLGNFLDGKQISIQLEAVDLNNEKITFSLASGELPPGISLSSSGLISGLLIPNTSGNYGAISGWGEAHWDEYPWQFTPYSTNYTYNFTVDVTDGKAYVNQSYSINVYAHNDIRADNAKLTADSILFTADTDANRTPILLTNQSDLGDYANFTSGNYFAFKFQGIDLDNVPVGYAISGAGNSGGWDEDTNGWDSQPWDQSPYSLPYGLSLDPNTGWLTGYVPELSTPMSVFKFGMYVYNFFDPSIKSEIKIFTINLLSALDLRVNWITDSDLGHIDNGSVSQLYVQATTPSNRKLYYSLANGSKLPQGLVLQNDGIISGRVTFQSFGIDGNYSSRTTFDVNNYNLGMVDAPTTFDSTYTFTVLAQDYSNNKTIKTITNNTIATIIYGSTTFTVVDTTGIEVGHYVTGVGFLADTRVIGISDNSITINYATTESASNINVQFYSVTTSVGLSGQKTFTLKTNSITYSSYDDLYIVAKPQLAKRQILNTILGNTDYFANDDIYRPTDPWWGIQNEIKVLVGYGLTPTQSSSYIEAMKTRHYNKKFYFGDYGYAQAKDDAGNVIYDVVYINLIEDTKTYKTSSGQTFKVLPDSSVVTHGTENLNTVFDEYNTTYDYERLKFIDTVTGRVVYPNDLDYMYNDLVVAVGSTNTNTLPRWQTSIQANGKTLGFQTAAVLAYLKPGTGERVLYKLKNNVPADIKSIPFVADRYILDNNLDSNFDLAAGKWITKNYTTFDTGYQSAVASAATVDFAIDIPFDHIYRQTTTAVDLIGGLDGSHGDYNGKTIIFSTQENYSSAYGTLTNNGWNKDNSIVPGYTEFTNGTSSLNQRSGVWLITVTKSIINLTFLQEIRNNDIVSVRFGYRGGRKLQYNPENVGVGAQTVPTYTLANVDTVQLKSPTTFDGESTRFVNNVDQYTTPFTNDKYLKFPRIGVFS